MSTKEKSKCGGAKTGAGRLEIPIDFKKVETLLISGCSGVEVASHIGVHFETLYDRVKKEFGIPFSEYSQAFKQKGESLLRHKQFCKAMGYCQDGDNTQLVWLGKQRLGQRETPTEVDVSEKTLVQFKSIMNQLDGAQSSKADNASADIKCKSDK